MKPTTNYQFANACSNLTKNPDLQKTSCDPYNYPITNNNGYPTTMRQLDSDENEDNKTDRTSIENLILTNKIIEKPFKYCRYEFIITEVIDNPGIEMKKVFETPVVYVSV